MVTVRTRDEPDGGVGFWAAAFRHGEKPAIIDATGASISFGVLLELVNRYSHLLQSVGLTVGSHMAYIVPNSVDAIALPLAAQQIGVYHTPINFHLLPREIAHVLRDSKSELFIAHVDFAESAQGAAREAGLGADRALAVGGTIEGLGDLMALAETMPTQLPESRSYGPVFFYTSGTTGYPKGVISSAAGTPIRESNESALGALWDGLGYSGDMTFLVQGPLYHGGPLGYSMPAIHRGGMLVMMQKWTPERALQLIQEHRVSSSFMVPTMFHRLLALDEEVRLSHDIRSMKGVGHSGAICPVPIKRAMIDWWGPIFTEVYGGSEGTIAMCNSVEWLSHPGTVGRVVAGKEVEIVDEETGLPCLAGEIGTIFVDAPGVEYFDDPVKTAASKRGDMMTLGDVGYLSEDGWLYLVDRRTDLIVAGGVNIYPAEVELVLLEHRHVEDAAVIGVSHPEWGQEVVAAIQLTLAARQLPEGEVLAAVRSHAETNLARFKMPRTITVVEELPRTPAGKLLRRRLREGYEGDSE